MDENFEENSTEPSPTARGGIHHRRRIQLQGILQGVGFRPCVYHLAHQHKLAGWVQNDLQGVTLEVEGEPAEIERFLLALPRSLPPSAQIDSRTEQPIAPLGEERFVIRAGDRQPRLAQDSTAAILPDLAPCAECLGELLDDDDRRNAYPFLNCTRCGPRFSILESLPYDRPRTTMRHFPMCSACRQEYEDATNRRFHAQPNACPQCGPALAWCDSTGQMLSQGPAALESAAAALTEGKIVALKGVGGLQLLVAAGNSTAVGRLRSRKARPTQPLAVMIRSLAHARQLCHVSGAESELLASQAAPIVLLDRRPAELPDPALRVADNVAPSQPRLGLMLPSSPLHHLLMRQVPFPVVATSGNLHSEPICIDNQEAVERLGSIADAFLLHNRPIVRPIDDSVAVVWDEIPRVWRRARGYAPLPIHLPGGRATILAMGADQKNTVALRVGEQLVISQHLGDLESELSLASCWKSVGDLLRIHSVEPRWIVHDAHPDYHATRLAKRLAADFPAARTLAVQHHHAHFAACLAEHRLWDDHETLGVIWDGTGYGLDGTIWGGEFLAGGIGSCRRVAALRGFPLLGGERAILQPGRVALALLWQILGCDVWQTPLGRTFPTAQQSLLERMLLTGHSSVTTSSMGRLFDGLAALLDPRRQVTFSGEAAMAVEATADPGESGYHEVPIERDEEGIYRLDWRPLFAEMAAALKHGDSAGRVAARFHNSLVRALVEVARQVGLPRVVLSGGCFQNRRLTEQALRLLRRAGFTVLLHRQVPPGDGGISLGQAAVAAARAETPRDP